MSALDALRSQHTSQGKCGCCWNQVDRDHPNNRRTVCSCGQHEPCGVARALDSAITERDELRAEVARVRDAAKTLGEIVDRQALDALHAIGETLGGTLINKDGDGDWAAVWDLLSDLLPERDRLRATVERIRAALGNHPRCDVHPDDDPITCGWKHAVADITQALDGGAQ